MADVKTVAIGCDHAGYPYKKRIIALLESMGIAVQDFGTNSTESVDYPDFVHPVARAVVTQDAQLGIVMCGSGNGVAMVANKYADIRCAICWEESLASLARQHNNANILSIPVRFISEEVALATAKAFLEGSFEGGRHARRVEKINKV